MKNVRDFLLTSYHGGRNSPHWRTPPVLPERTISCLLCPLSRAFQPLSANAHHKPGLQSSQESTHILRQQILALELINKKHNS